MFSYTIDYRSLTGKAKLDKGLKDCKEWLTKEQDKALYELAMLGVSLNSFRFYAAITGVKGYPVRAYYMNVKQTCRDMSE